MPPTFLQFSSEQYKENTDSIATWLAVCARKCGFPANLLNGETETSEKQTSVVETPKLKGRARQLAAWLVMPLAKESTRTLTPTQLKQHIDRD